MPAGAGRWATRGQAAALAAVARMVQERPEHAVLLVGPSSLGKTTLAIDLAAGLLCSAPDRSDRPCGGCRSCRMLAGGNHPDLHRLGPEGPGGQVVIGDPNEPRGPWGVRDLVRELALLPVEGGARVAVIEGASRMNEDAQNALLKTLEEPPPGVHIVLCADEEEALLPTVRSRCTRIRLGPVGPRDIEALLADLGLADAPTAARLAGVTDGRPGLAVAYARSPETIVLRDEISRTLLDLLAAPPARRLAAGRDLMDRARDLAMGLGGPLPEAAARGRPPARAGGSTVRAGARTVSDDPAPGLETAAAASADGDEPGPAGRSDGEAPKASAAERRLAVRHLLAIWRDLARDLAVAGAGGRREVRDPGLLDELVPLADRLPAGAAAGFLARLDRTAELLAGNVSPELALDVLLLTWPTADRTAA